MQRYTQVFDKASGSRHIVPADEGEYVTFEDAEADAQSALLAKDGELKEACEAISALLVMMDRSKPRKLDEALTWIENDNLARSMAEKVLARQALSRDGK